MNTPTAPNKAVDIHSTQDNAASNVRKFNPYSIHDWSIWMAYGSIPSGSSTTTATVISSKELFQSSATSKASSSISNNTEGPQKPSPTVAVSTVALNPPSKEISANEIINTANPDKVNSGSTSTTLKKQPRIQPKEPTPAEKRFFESAEVVLMNAGVGFLLGSNLAYLIDTKPPKTSATIDPYATIPTRSAFYPNPEEFVRNQNHLSNNSNNFSATNSSKVPVSSGFRRTASSSVMKPELRVVEDRARKVAMQGAQTSALAAAFTITLEVNDHYLKRKRDAFTYAIAGTIAGLTQGVLVRPFTVTLTLQRTSLLAGVGAVYALIEEHLGDGNNNK